MLSMCLHVHSRTYLYSCLRPRCILAYRYTCGFLECCCSRCQRYNLRCSWHTRRYLHYHGYHAWIWQYWQARHYSSHSLLLPAQNLLLSQIFPSTHSLAAAGLTTHTSWLDRFFWASPFFVFSSFITFLFVPVRQSKLAIRQHVASRRYSVSYHVVA